MAQKAGELRAVEALRPPPRKRATGDNVGISQDHPSGPVTPAATSKLTAREATLREDMNREYYVLVETVAQFDSCALMVKGWSVTLSLAALGLGFQQQHYALFALGSLTALGFWFLDLLLKSFQVRYYARMRDIAYVASQLNSLKVPGVGQVSSPASTCIGRRKAGSQEKTGAATRLGG